MKTEQGTYPRHSKKRLAGYKKPKPPRHHHSFETDTKGVKRCRCGKTKLPKKKGGDPKDKVRNAASTQKRMPPPQRDH